MKMLGILILATLIVSARMASFEEINSTDTVNTLYGQVRGRQQYTLFYRKPYHAFKGIPYGKPPIGELRFKPPQKATPWANVLEAFEFGNNCVQPGNVGNEDCLYLNVYTTTLSPSANLPVLIAFHGGSFFEGSGDGLGPDFLINQEDIVLVSINYRLGPLGFMSLRTSEYSGNMGLKDQLLSINWTKDNIVNFGGDPNKITLYGLSAGGTSVHLQVISPAAQGLFQRAIMASGTALNPHTITFSEHLERLYPFAYENGLRPENLNQIIDFLKYVDPYLLTDRTIKPSLLTPEGRIIVDLFWAPVIEPVGSLDPMFIESPAAILENTLQSNVDTFFGQAAAESYLFINDELVNPVLLEPFDRVFQISLPLYQMNYNLNFNSEMYMNMTEQIRNFYFGSHGGRVGFESLWEYSQMISDVTFNYGINRAVKLHANRSSGKTFYYRFSVEALFNFVRWVTHAPILMFPGATHGDDIFYAFGTEGALSIWYNSVAENSLERLVITQLSKMYTDFMVHGNPLASNNEINLDPASATVLNFIDITNNGLVPGIEPNGNNMHFWDQLFDENNLWKIY